MDDISDSFRRKTVTEEIYIPLSKWRYTTIIPAVMTYKVCLELLFQSTTQYIYRRLEDEFSNRNESLNSTFEGQLSCNSTSGHGDSEKEAQAVSAQWLLYFNLSAYGIGVFTSTILGALSDVVGRKILLIIPLIGALGQTLVGTLVVFLDLDISFLVLSNLLNGLGGTHYAHNLGCFAYISDLTNAGKSRSFGLGMMDINISLGLALANIGAGYLIKYIGFSNTCWIALGSLCVSIVLTVFTVPETLKEKKDFEIKSVWNNIRENFKTFSYAQKENRLRFFILISCYTIFLFPEVSGAGIDKLFQLNYPFCWDSEMIGWYYAANFVITQVIGVLLIKVIHLCLEDESMAVIGCLSTIALDVVTALAVNTLMLYLASLSGIVSTVTLPAIRGMLSRLVCDHNQGSMYATLTALEVLSRFASSSAFSGIYGNTQSFMPGLVYLIKACFSFVTFCLLWVLLIKKKTNLKISINAEVGE